MFQYAAYVMNLIKHLAAEQIGGAHCKPATLGTQDVTHSMVGQEVDESSSTLTEMHRTGRYGENRISTGRCFPLTLMNLFGIVATHIDTVSLVNMAKPLVSA